MASGARIFDCKHLGFGIKRGSLRLSESRILPFYTPSSLTSLLAAISISRRSEADRTLIPLSCLKNNKVVLVRDYH